MARATMPEPPVNSPSPNTSASSALPSAAASLISRSGSPAEPESTAASGRSSSDLRVQPLQLRVQLVEGVDISLGGGDDDVGVRALAVDDAPVLGEPHRHFALRVGAGGDVVDRVEQELRPAFHDRLDRLERGIHGAAAPCLGP